ncbi:hypothetical protein HHI36_007057 [Cryptolaemus montrouzieri]|uniref:Uncharacterized protein n=1 Tax=Cryptolaemus montrouzieri TaxID=559131 RepID=A0ABD2MNU5_9CUCU
MATTLIIHFVKVSISKRLLHLYYFMESFKERCMKCNMLTGPLHDPEAAAVAEVLVREAIGSVAVPIRVQFRLKEEAAGLVLMSTTPIEISLSQPLRCQAKRR